MEIITEIDAFIRTILCSGYGLVAEKVLVFCSGSCNTQNSVIFSSLDVVGELSYCAVLQADRSIRALFKKKMVQATHAIRRNQLAKMLQKVLGVLFTMESSCLFGNAFISVTAVYLDGDLSMARVYLSVSLNNNEEALLQKILYKKNTIRRLLGKRLAGKMRKIPDLKFYIDHTVVQGARVSALIDQLDASKA